MNHSSRLKTAFLTFPFCIMSFFSVSLRASLVLLLLAGAPRAGCASAAAGPAPCTPVAARAVPATDSTAAPLVRLHLGNVELCMQPPTSPAAQTVVLLGRVVVRGLRYLTGHANESF